MALVGVSWTIYMGKIARKPSTTLVVLEELAK